MRSNQDQYRDQRRDQYREEDNRGQRSPQSNRSYGYESRPPPQREQYDTGRYAPRQERQYPSRSPPQQYSQPDRESFYRRDGSSRVPEGGYGSTSQYERSYNDPRQMEHGQRAVYQKPYLQQSYQTSGSSQSYQRNHVEDHRDNWRPAEQRQPPSSYPSYPSSNQQSRFTSRDSPRDSRDYLAPKASPFVARREPYNSGSNSSAPFFPRREPYNSGSNSPAPFVRRKKTPSSLPPPLPSRSYLERTMVASTPLSRPPAIPPLLVLDLNNTLLFRPRRTAEGSTAPVPRDYLQSFLEYVAGSADPSFATKNDGKTARNERWTTIIYSSARRSNVRRMATAIGLIPNFGEDIQEEHIKVAMARNRNAEENEGVGKGWGLRLIWSREMMGLSAEEFVGDVETVKDLDRVWSELDGGIYNCGNSVLLDDEPSKCVMQPYSHVPITPFATDASFLPVAPRSSSRPASPTSTAVKKASEYSVASLAQHLPPDTALLSSIAILESLRREGNMANFIREGGIARMIAKEGEYGLSRRGSRILKDLGIPETRAWSSRWNLS